MYYYDVLMRGTRGPNPVLTYSSEFNLGAGQVVLAPIGRRRLMGVVLKATTQPKFKTKPISPVKDVVLPETTLSLVDWLAEYYGVSPSMALRLVLPARLPKTAKSPVSIKTRGRGLRKLSLNEHQIKAIDTILGKTASTYLLHGQTASGKTLIYRELAKRALSTGRSTIILVPEIALTPQVVADLSDLSEQVFVSHSALSPTQRQQIWLYCLQHEKPVVLIGPRSTLFYPLSDIGLIVVDEAHENSYKQEQSPRYQAQTVAAKIADLHHARLVLGSATPRLTDYWQAKARSAPIVTLPRHKPSQSKVEIVDQTKESQFSRSRIISNKLLDELATVLKNGGQSLLYLNRRGTAALAICSDCGWVPLCPRCGVPVNLHHDESILLCHQCGWQQQIPINCPICGSSELIYRGAGTKAVEREIKRLLPAARVARFDSDNPKSLSFAQLYPEIYKRKLDILIGTQSLAVGLDLPGLDLVGVVSADSELYLPDYTASERAFQLLYQVIGRAGRQGGGRIIIQTHHPEHPAINRAIHQDYIGFYESEIAKRQEHSYPPFGFLMTALFQAKSNDRTARVTEKMSAHLSKHFGLNTLGPAPAFYFKRGGHWRYVIVIKSKHRAKLVEAAHYLAEQPGWQVDIDPINLLV